MIPKVKMINVILFLMSILLISGFIGCQKETIKMYRNPIIPGFHPDPSICRVGDDYYLVTSTFEYFPGVPVFHSKDLVHWELIGHCLTRESQLPLHHLRASQGIYAPTLRYHDGTFYLITTNVSAGGNFFVTAKDPAGPWSEPVWIDPVGIDPSLFFDDDGKVYLIRQAEGQRGYILQREFNLETGMPEGESKNIWNGTGGVWPEGPHMYKINGMYYLMISEGGTSYEHMVTLARSDSPWGPFESCPHNPILTHTHLESSPIQAIGHADLVETPDGWWLVCLGIRPQGGRFHHMGRETFLVPAKFDENGWLVVNNNEPISFEMNAPDLPQHPWPVLPEKDEFDADKLNLYWNYLRNPDMSHYSLTDNPGFLRLTGSEVTLQDQDSPTFVGRRQTDLSCVASTELLFDPQKENEEAGFTVLQNNKYHYDIGVKLMDGKRQVFFKPIVDNALAQAVQSVEIGPGPVILKIKATPLAYEFSFTPENGEETVLGTAATKDLSVERIGFKDGMCFTGTYFGLYASGNGEPSTVPADFDWYEYQGQDKRN